MSFLAANWTTDRSSGAADKFVELNRAILFANSTPADVLDFADFWYAIVSQVKKDGAVIIISRLDGLDGWMDG